MNTGSGEAYEGDDRLPWLETVDEDYDEGQKRGRVFLYVFVALLLAGIVIFGYYYVRQYPGQAGNGELIKAQQGDYKVKPDEPGGMKVEGQGDSVFATSQGSASNASINVGALPEAPIEGKAAPKGTAGAAPGTRRATISVPGTATKGGPSASTRPAASAPALGGGSGSLVQLGAFPNEAGANIAWARLTKRFAYLAPLGKSVERAQVGDKSVFRLRVNAGSNGQAREICGKLRVAGENCFVAS
ncbi:SPOR domain-containing protein [Sphingomonas sp. JC676]|uniref:SPOR domain-containing protein n=1 Tax=Sphingomonas sp. JC676 TaxID=2768065 RepID=UPI001657C995|nr:SPOR domain-containing protein [Sphingomonas sp. JC676]MBC9032349.1 SPOR domain-containing protein [Sphingomonas sp. JC676]